MIALTSRTRARSMPVLVTTVLTTVLVLMLASCTGGSDDEPAASQTPAASGASGVPTPASKPIKVRVTRVSGRLAEKDRPALEANVGAALTTYVEGAFTGGGYPRQNFSDAYAAFTEGAARSARKDRALLTNATLGSSTRSVRLLRGTAYLSVLAPYQVAAGVTAKVNLWFAVDRADAPAERLRLTGRILLTRKKTADGGGDWQIFGYDLARGGDAR